jgi:FtsP/CotA-like multicopper oxidase with cupredoxin domain
MERFIWGFDGKKFSEAGPIELKRGDRVRFVLRNTTAYESCQLLEQEQARMRRM